MNRVCNSCKKEWDDTSIFESIRDYGFINLTSQDDEYIAFSCPGKECYALIYFNGPRNISSNFVSSLVAYLDPSGYDSHKAQIKYFGSLPFCQRNQTILTSKGAICSPDESLWEHEIGIASTGDVLDSDFYCSFNDKQLNAYGPIMQVWWYKKDFVEELLEEEGNSRLSLFPRYVIGCELIEKINRLHSLKMLQNNRPEGSEYNSPSIYSESLNKIEICRQFEFLKILTPTPYDIFDSFDDSAVEGFWESDILWKLFHNNYVSEQLTKQSYLFTNEIIEIYSKTKFSSHVTHKLISGFRKNIFEGLSSRRRREHLQDKADKDLIAQSEKEAPGFSDIISNDGNVALIKLKLSRILKKSNKIAPILLTGETGVGKTYFAGAIHKASGRQGKYVKVNMSAIPKELFESHLFGHVKGAFTGADATNEGVFLAAEGGTLLLDEIGEIDTVLQAKLLKVIEDREIQPVGSSVSLKVNILIVLGTNINLNEAVAKKTFRSDLLYRITTNSIEIPPLRARKKDILLLSKYFVNEFGKRSFNSKWTTVNISTDAAAALRDYKWPGNIRQLQGVIESILGQRIEDDFSDISAQEVRERLLFGETGTEGRTSDDVSFDKIVMVNGPPVVNPAPGKRKMPGKENLEDIIRYFYEQEGRVYGVITKAANHIGVAPRHVSEAIDEHRIILPWVSAPPQGL